MLSSLPQLFPGIIINYSQTDIRDIRGQDRVEFPAAKGRNDVETTSRREIPVEMKFRCRI